MQASARDSTICYTFGMVRLPDSNPRTPACADPGIFVRGGPGQPDIKKALTVFFFCFFLVLSLFYRSQMVNFKDIYHFSRFQWGSNFFQGGGVQLLIPYRNHTCDTSRIMREAPEFEPYLPHSRAGNAISRILNFAIIIFSQATIFTAISTQF